MNDTSARWQRGQRGGAHRHAGTSTTSRLLAGQADSSLVRCHPIAAGARSGADQLTMRTRGQQQAALSHAKLIDTRSHTSSAAVHCSLLTPPPAPRPCELAAQPALLSSPSSIMAQLTIDPAFGWVSDERNLCRCNGQISERYLDVTALQSVDSTGRSLTHSPLSAWAHSTSIFFTAACSVLDLIDALRFCWNVRSSDCT